MGINDFNGNNQIDAGDIELRKDNLKKQNPNQYLKVLESEVRQKLSDTNLSQGEKEILLNHLNGATKIVQNYNVQKFESKMNSKLNLGTVHKTKEWYHLKWARDNLKIGDKRLLRAEEEFKITQMKLSTSNDNLFNSNGKDDGKSFGFHGELKASKGNKDYYLKADMDAFTKNPHYHKQKDGAYQGKGVGQRIDRIQISAGRENIKVSEKLRGKIGVGVEKTGNFNGEKIQNGWHKGAGKSTMEKGQEYTVHAPYDKGTSGGYVEGGIDWKSNRDNGLYVGAGIEGKLNVIGKGGGYVDGKGFVGYKGEKFNVEFASGNRKNYEPSSTIAFGEPGGAYAEVSAGYEITKRLSIDASLKNINDSPRNSYGSVGFTWKF